jgi:DNA ligase-1
MKRFAELLDRLLLTPSRNGKLTLLVDYFAAVPDPERGLALAAITRDLSIASIKPAMLRALVEERVDPVLFGLSYDYVGDLAETIALIWATDAEASDRRNDVPTISEVVEQLEASSRAAAPALVADWLDRLDASGRYALIKLVTGGLRIGVSSRLAKQALADFGKVDVIEIEELWHGLAIPYTPLFDWLEGRRPKPANLAAAPFRPVMLATAIEDGDLDKLDPGDYAAEWKWDGIRVQATSEKGVRRLYTRTGDDISGTFPDIVEHLDFEGSMDGELLVARTDVGDDGLLSDGQHAVEIASFSDLQQRLNRKIVSAKTIRDYPAFIRAYDLMQDGGDDLRALPFRERRQRLEAFVARLEPRRFDLSPLVPFTDWSEIVAHRTEPPHPVIEGLMLKRWDSAYVPGRPRGPWFKWKREPFVIDAVLMYAQRGHGKRSSFYSDYTFGVWKGEPGEGELVPVGKAYFGFTDDELKLIDKFVRDNTIERFGPVRSVRANAEAGLVLEVAFEGLNRSARHKSGVAMRFPRISKLRWDKPSREADRIETLERMLPPA